MEKRFVGIEIGGTKLQVVTSDGKLEIRERRRLDVEREKGAEGIRRQIESALRETLSKEVVAAIGVGFGGPVDWKTGTVRCSHHIEGWNDFALADWLRSVTSPGVTVRVDNDANVAALGETLHGVGRGLNPVFYVTLGSGVGGGLVVDERIYHGAPPGEAEIGHVRLDRNGTTVESRCSGWAVDARIRELKGKAGTSVLAKAAAEVESGEARFLGDALKAGDPVAEQLLREVAEDLAFGLSHVVHLAHPEAIILGGGLSKVGEPLRAAVESALERFTMEAFRPAPRVRLAGLGEDAVPMGALALAASTEPQPG